MQNLPVLVSRTSQLVLFYAFEADIIVRATDAARLDNLSFSPSQVREERTGVMNYFVPSRRDGQKNRSGAMVEPGAQVAHIFNSWALDVLTQSH